MLLRSTVVWLMVIEEGAIPSQMPNTGYVPDRLKEKVVVLYDGK